MPKKIQIEILPAKTFEIKKGHKYLIIMPQGYVSDGAAPLQSALQAFFGNNKVLVIGAQDINKIKIAEVFND